MLSSARSLQPFARRGSRDCVMGRFARRRRWRRRCTGVISCWRWRAGCCTTPPPMTPCCKCATSRRPPLTLTGHSREIALRFKALRGERRLQAIMMSLVPQTLWQTVVDTAGAQQLTAATFQPLVAWCGRALVDFAVAPLCLSLCLVTSHERGGGGGASAGSPVPLRCCRSRQRRRGLRPHRAHRRYSATAVGRATSSCAATITA